MNNAISNKYIWWWSAAETAAAVAFLDELDVADAEDAAAVALLDELDAAEASALVLDQRLPPGRRARQNAALDAVLAATARAATAAAAARAEKDDQLSQSLSQQMTSPRLRPHGASRKSLGAQTRKMNWAILAREKEKGKGKEKEKGKGKGKDYWQHQKELTQIASDHQVALELLQSLKRRSPRSRSSSQGGPTKKKQRASSPPPGGVKADDFPIQAKFLPARLEEHVRIMDLVAKRGAKREFPPLLDRYVKARWQGGKEWYVGRVMDVNKDGTYNIKYDDGDVEYNVKRKFIKLYPEKKISAKQIRVLAEMKKEYEAQSTWIESKTNADGTETFPPLNLADHDGSRHWGATSIEDAKSQFNSLHSKDCGYRIEKVKRGENGLLIDGVVANRKLDKGTEIFFNSVWMPVGKGLEDGKEPKLWKKGDILPLRGPNKFRKPLTQDVIQYIQYHQKYNRRPGQAGQEMPIFFSDLQDADSIKKFIGMYSYECKGDGWECVPIIPSGCDIGMFLNEPPKKTRKVGQVISRHKPNATIEGDGFQKVKVDDFNNNEIKISKTKIVLTRDVKKNEEIVWDYGPAYKREYKDHKYVEEEKGKKTKEKEYPFRHQLFGNFPKFKIGEKVSAFFGGTVARGSSRYFNATIKEAMSGNRYKVEWDDGDPSEILDASKIRSILPGGRSRSPRRHLRSPVSRRHLRSPVRASRRSPFRSFK